MFRSKVLSISAMLVVVAVVAVVPLLPAVNSQSYHSNKYPAGLHPSLCPHYPYCDNSVLGEFAEGVAAIHHGGSAVPGYPASLSPHACPNYPYCSHQIPREAIHYRRAAVAPSRRFASSTSDRYARQLTPSLATVAAKYPSGVDPLACPNYPYCP